jgi:phosphohistidine phosphatase
MARQLWLLRHADAEPHGTRPDAERRLTERGERQARLAGTAIARMGVEFDALLSSPRERALRTARMVEQALGGRSQSAQRGGELEVHAPLSGGFDAPRALATLADVAPSVRLDGRVLLVGHEPDLSTVVEQLTGARIDLKKGGLAVVRLEGGAVGRRPASRAPGSATFPAGELLLLLRPVELALIAGESATVG